MEVRLTRTSDERPDQPLNHHFTIDVEEYFHAHALKPWVSQTDWDTLDRRAPEMMERLLDAMDEFGAKGTFFILSWLASREKEMVRAIAERGHEIASHGWDHKRVDTQTPTQFRSTVRDSKAQLEELSGQEVLGFRAPSFSILPGSEWAFDVLLEEGYRYDSSLFPVAHHPSYGYPNSPPDPYWIERTTGRLLEVPPATLRLFGQRFAAAGGAYLRFFPLALTRKAIRQAELREAPATLYIHPWELYKPELSVPISLMPRIRMQHGSGKMWRCLRRLFGTYSFTPIRSIIPDVTPIGVEESENETSRRLRKTAS